MSKQSKIPWHPSLKAPLFLILSCNIWVQKSSKQRKIKRQEIACVVQQQLFSDKLNMESEKILLLAKQFFTWACTVQHFERFFKIYGTFFQFSIITWADIYPFLQHHQIGQKCIFSILLFYDLFGVFHYAEEPGQLWSKVHFCIFLRFYQMHFLKFSFWMIWTLFCAHVQFWITNHHVSLVSSVSLSLFSANCTNFQMTFSKYPSKNFSAQLLT